MTPRFIFIAFSALLATLIVAGCDREGPDAAREGNDAFASERYGDAREAYDRALKTMPDRPELDYNSGNTLYREQRFAEAGTRYDDAFPDAERLLARDTAFNSGNAQLEAGNLEEAIELYKQALRIDPSDEDAKYNLELALEDLEEQQPENEGEEEQESEEGGEEGEPQPQPGPGEPQTDDQQGQQDQPQGQQDENEGQEGDESDGGESQPPGDQQPRDQSPRQQEVPPTGLTEEEARRLLDSVAENTDTLQSRMRRRDDGPPREPPEKPW